MIFAIAVAMFVVGASVMWIPMANQNAKLTREAFDRECHLEIQHSLANAFDNALKQKGEECNRLRAQLARSIQRDSNGRIPKKVQP